MIRHIAFAAFLGLAAAACSSASATSTSDSASSFCQGLCPAYLGCEAAAKSPVTAPLFCNVDPKASCQTACEQTAEGLGQSESTFLGCGTCVLQYDAADVCDYSKAGQAGQVSCPDSCSNAGAASSKFYDDFTTALPAQIQTDALTADCTETGTRSWAADDPAFTHPVGGDGGNGTWTCQTADGCGYGGYQVMAGPYLALPPGSYTAGFTGVHVSNISGAGVEVSAGGSAPFVQQTWTQVPSTVSVSFKLTKFAQKVVISLGFATDSNAATGSIGGAFITRH